MEKENPDTEQLKEFLKITYNFIEEFKFANILKAYIIEQESAEYAKAYRKYLKENNIIKISYDNRRVSKKSS